MSKLPAVQKAWRAHRRGRPRDVLSLDTVPLPTLKDGEVLVRIQAAALNPIGYKLMGLLPSFALSRPYIPEHDFAGYIVDSNNVPNFKEGDLVWGAVPPLGKIGALAQYVAVTEDNVAHRPSNLSLEEAAGLAVIGITAYDGLFHDCGVQPGQTVFVNGGSSSLGGISIKMLKARGCTVWTSCSARNIDLVKSFGADKVLDYQVKPLHKQLIADPPSPKFDAIFDAIGGYKLFTNCEAYLTPSGIYGAPGNDFDSFKGIPGELWGRLNKSWRPTWLGGANRKYKPMFATGSKETIAAVTKIVEEGPAAPHIDSVYEFDDVLSAYDRIMTKRATGKIIIKVS